MKNENIYKMKGEKVIGADNQQEKLDANWIVGFVDGEDVFISQSTRFLK